MTFECHHESYHLTHFVISPIARFTCAFHYRLGAISNSKLSSSLNHMIFLITKSTNNLKLSSVFSSSSQKILSSLKSLHEDRPVLVARNFRNFAIGTIISGSINLLNLEVTKIM